MNPDVAEQLIKHYLSRSPIRIISNIDRAALREAIAWVEATRGHRCWCACDCTEAET